MKAKRLLKKLNYLPRWAWYVGSLSIGGPIGPVFVYLGFHVLEKMAKDEEEDELTSTLGWDVDIDDSGVHVRSHKRRRASSTYQDKECIVTDENEMNVHEEWARTEESARRAQETIYDGPAKEAMDRIAQRFLGEYVPMPAFAPKKRRWFQRRQKAPAMEL